MAAHLPGMCAAIFPMPVIGIPMHTTSDLGGSGFPVFYRTDAVRYSGSYRCHQRRCQCRHSGSKDPGNFRRRASWTG